MRILVCGGRDYGDLVSLNRRRDDPRWAKREKEYTMILRTLDKITWDRRGDNDEDANGNWLSHVTIISGGATGADTVGIDWAVVNWCRFEEYPADWSQGKNAGPIRNAVMLEEGKPDLVIAFPGGKGTANMVKLATEANVEVIEVSEDGNIKHRSQRAGT
jgi:hypothetical protein